MEEEEEETYQITAKGAALALRAEQLIKGGMSLEEAAVAVGLNSDIELRILLLLMPSITSSDELEDMELQ